MAGSLFITAIAVHTYLAVVRKYTPPQWAVYATVAFLWAFDYSLAILGVFITRNGEDVGGYYVRAPAWVGAIPLSISGATLRFNLALITE